MDFERLMARHKDAVYRQMVRMCGNADDADDVLSESLLSAYRAMHQLSDEAAFQSWLAIIARRTCGRLKRREALAPVLRLAELSEQGIEPASAEPSLDNQVIEAETKACLLQVLTDLPPLYREVYELRDLQGRPASEVAERLGISVAAVKSRLHRARALVRAGIDSGLSA
ncbi:RNA polymerase sigma factor [Armatimonas rosea]|uniref:RNA polymerase sigma-70 factor (ECF subfamily) n=1 Tax=Armatimonas rosea TaxID=685828 RepID=A0A7W9W6A3_ARMRO|nr:RNA polymerase sigma factor [Armatimonas rosea]MBB6049815.1 RNA polymerase sigma-70 factor (ECF subfamily) [Armatimonas rosea]